MRPDIHRWHIRLAAATLAALVLIVLGALFLIAPVWQPRRPSRKGEEEAALAPKADPQPDAEGLLDVNTATARQLTALPGVGSVKADAIVAYRQANGPFATLQDVAKVSGISTRMVESWQGLATAGQQKDVQ